MDYEELNFQGIPAERQWEVSAAFPVLMRKVYVWMTLALVITGFTAYAVASSPGILQAIYTNPILMWGLIIAEFVLVIGVSAALNRLSLTTATLMFILYSVINGALLSSVFVIYTASSVATVFFITAGTFGAMTIFGYVTRQDLSKIGSFLFMALIGLILCAIVNMFMHSSTMDLLISCAGVLIFVGLTAWDTQSIKRMTAEADPSMVGKVATMGALSLYLDFINLFLYLLRFFGSRD